MFLKNCIKDLQVLSPCRLTPVPVTEEAFTDASLTGWGLHYGNRELKGRWSPMVSRLHINLLELLVILILVRRMTVPAGSHVRVHCDNTTTVLVIRRGGLSVQAAERDIPSDSDGNSQEKYHTVCGISQRLPKHHRPTCLQ